MAEGGGRYSPLRSCSAMSRWDWLLLIVLCVIPLAGGFVGARLFNTGIYKDGTIAKPDWAPSAKVFSPVWVLLFLAMGAASFIVYKSGGGVNAETSLPLGLYLLQLLLCWLWTPAFFGFGQFALAELILGATLGAVAAAVAAFARVSVPAALLLAPLLVWLAFAAALNHHIVLLNGPYLNFTIASQ